MSKVTIKTDGLLIIMVIASFCIGGLYGNYIAPKTQVCDFAHNSEMFNESGEYHLQWVAPNETLNMSMGGFGREVFTNDGYATRGGQEDNSHNPTTADLPHHIVNPVHTSDIVPEDCQTMIAGMILFHPPHLIIGFAYCNGSATPNYYNVVSDDGEGSLWVNASRVSISNTSYSVIFKDDIEEKK
jgi:hypothetical protein